MKKCVVIPDIHHPYHNKKAWFAILKFIKWFKPQVLVLLGDAIEMRAIDHWKREKGNLKAFEGKRLLHDYQDFKEDILLPLEKLCPRAERYYLFGNHEDWQYQLVEANPQLEGLIEIENVLKLKEKWKVIPYLIRTRRGAALRGKLKLGKLTLIHGEYTNKYHAAKTSDSYLKSVMYAHTHDRQLFTKVHVEDPADYHTCQSIGCVCDRSPQYLWGRPNRWVHAFAILYIRPNGLFTDYVPIIIDGQFTYAGKTFSYK